jgi:hypothetical protein
MAAEQTGMGIFNQMQTSRSKRPALIGRQEILLILVRFSPSDDDLQVVSGCGVHKQGTRACRNECLCEAGGNRVGIRWDRTCLEHVAQFRQKPQLVRLSLQFLVGLPYCFLRQLALCDPPRDAGDANDSSLPILNG